MGHAIDRRRALAALAGAASGSAIVGSANAFRLEEGDAARLGLMATRCESVLTHDEMVKELFADLDVQPDARDSVLSQLRASPCPFCGCRLGALEPPPEDAPAPRF
jgi:hypothetical protein